jgi:hypothetical protein
VAGAGSAGVGEIGAGFGDGEAAAFCVDVGSGNLEVAALAFVSSGFATGEGADADDVAGTGAAGETAAGATGFKFTFVKSETFVLV